MFHLQSQDSKREATLFLSFYLDATKNHLSRGSAKVVVVYDRGNIGRNNLKPGEEVKVRYRTIKAKGLGEINRITIISARSTTKLEGIIAAVEKIAGPSQQLVAAQLTFPNGKKRVFISPWSTRFLNLFQEWRQAHVQMETAKNNGSNGSTIRFFERAERVAQGNLMIDCGLSQIDEHRAELLKAEIENFEKGFEVFL